MTAIPLKDIADCLLDKHNKEIAYLCDDVQDWRIVDKIITLQGEVRLTLSLEKLAKCLFLKSKTTIEGKYVGQKWEAWNKSVDTRNWYYGLADAILADLKDLIMVEK